MPAQWTADVVGRMHLFRISKRELADQAGVTPEYVSMVLNGHREPKGAKERFNTALERLITEKEGR